MKKIHEEAEDLDGFEDLETEDQEKVRKAWEDGHVADEDIPETARKPDADEDEEDDEEKPKKKRGPKKKDEDSDGSPKKGVFKLEYASQGRAKCKGTCLTFYVANAIKLTLLVIRCLQHVEVSLMHVYCLSCMKLTGASRKHRQGLLQIRFRS